VDDKTDIKRPLTGLGVAERTPQEPEKKDTHPTVIDYDADDYDYRNFWKGRDYEQWAERRVLTRLFNRVEQTPWLVDFGCGFGRNVVHYCQHAEHAVLIDYSLRNLENAASRLAKGIESGHIFLMRADLYRLPFVDDAFDTGLIVRVLHHLSQVDEALVEMGRTVGSQWILDVPVKHHIFARVRGLFRGETRRLSNWEPKSLGTAGGPFVNFHLAAVRHTLGEHGWDSNLVASVNNFRRWDKVLPSPATTALRPLVYGLETVAQSMGRGWWGPSQFLWATRRESVPPQPAAGVAPIALANTPWALLATKMFCPECHSTLQWTADAASCTSCTQHYSRAGAIWNFVPD